MAAELIAYCRVSTKQQGLTGLGMDAQRAAVESYARQHGARVAALYVEVESGKRADRPELAKALAHAKRSKAILCVAKLDRLARNVEFLARVMNSGCEFAAADMPAANRFMLHVIAAVAEHEAKAISDRTKAALGMAKARGALLGSARPGHWDGREQARQQGAAKGAVASAEVRSKAAVEAYSDLLPTMEELRVGGASLQAIADKLTADGHTTRRGRPWNAVQVARVLERAK
jgi:DNA invertase Pin-like site-specific DNA recombinase